RSSPQPARQGARRRACVNTHKERNAEGRAVASFPPGCSEKGPSAALPALARHQPCGARAPCIQPLFGATRSPFMASTDPSLMSLVFDRVSYHYPGSSQGLHDVSFEVGDGELVAVIGPSGSGKSTLLKLVAGLETGHSGRIALGGHDMAGTPVHRRGIGMVFQSYALFPHLSVQDNVAYGLALRGQPAAQRRARARELLEVVGLADYAQRAIAQLSGGQQ